MTWPTFYPFSEYYDPGAPWWRREFFMDWENTEPDLEVERTAEMNEEHMAALAKDPNAKAPAGMPPDIAEENRIIAELHRND